jgi:anti-sigma factor RsiW
MSRTDKKHFATEEWVDFVNGQLSTERTQMMQRHLNTECAKCSKVVLFWQQVRQTAKRESDYEAPESAVRHVRNAFAMAQPLEGKRRFEIPRLVFDSLWSPAAVGVRSASSTPRQLIYRAGEIAIEMQMQPEAHSDRISIAGQLSNAAQQGAGLAEIPVIVTSPNGKIVEASTNRFGEFHLGFVPEAGARISFEVAGENDLSVPLDGRGVEIFDRK